MKGLRLTIARQTVTSILDTLGEDDFFNIIAVGFIQIKRSYVICIVYLQYVLFVLPNIALR